MISRLVGEETLVYSVDPPALWAKLPGSAHQVMKHDDEHALLVFKDRVVVFKQDKKQVAVVLLNGPIRWCSLSGDLLWAAAGTVGFYNTTTKDSSSFDIKGHTFAAHGERLAAAAGGQLQLWEKGSLLASWQAHHSEVERMTMTADLLASCSREGALIKLWCAKTGRHLRTFRRGWTKTQVLFLGFCGDFLAAASARTLHIFDAKPDMWDLVAHPRAISQISFDKAIDKVVVSGQELHVLCGETLSRVALDMLGQASIQSAVSVV